MKLEKLKSISLILLLLFVLPSQAQHNAKEYTTLADKEHENGQYTSSIKLYTKAIEIDSTYAQAYLGRAISYNSMWITNEEKDPLLHKSFLKDLFQSYKLDSTSSYCNLLIADKTEIEQKEALVYYNRAIRYCNNNWAYFQHRVNCLMQLGMYTEAIEDLRKEYRILDKEDDKIQRKNLQLSCLLNEALCRAQLKDYKTAEKMIHKVINFNNAEYNSKLYFAIVLALQNKYDEAVNELKMILQNNPYYAIAYLCLGDIYKQNSQAQLKELNWSKAIQNGIIINESNNDLYKLIDFLVKKNNFK